MLIVDWVERHHKNSAQPRVRCGAKGVEQEYILETPEPKTIPLPPQRVPQAQTRPWPAGTSIVSTDSHLIEQENWFDSFPVDKKVQGLSMQFHDGIFDLSIGDRSMTPQHIARHRCKTMECKPDLAGYSDQRLHRPGPDSRAYR